MKTRFRGRAALLLLSGSLLAACAGTAPVSTPLTRGRPNYDTLPEAAIRAAAQEIERQVSEGNREPTLEGVDGLVVDTPSIRQAVRTRAARVELIRALLDSGNAWERRNGRIWIIRSPEYKNATTSRRRDIDAITVNSENRDRWDLYEGLLDANKLPNGSLAAVEEIFFEARREFMSTGQKFEERSGDTATVP